MNKYTRKYSILCYVFRYDTDFFSTSGVIGLHGPHLSIISPVLLQFLLISTMCCPLSSFSLLHVPHNFPTILKKAEFTWNTNNTTGSCRLLTRLFYGHETTLAHSPGGDPLYLQDLAQMRGDGAVQRLQFLVPPKLCVKHKALNSTAEERNCEHCLTLSEQVVQSAGDKKYAHVSHWTGPRCNTFAVFPSNMGATCGQWVTLTLMWSR